MTPKQKKYLAKLADYLAKLRPTKHRQFQMHSWFQVDTDPDIIVDTKTGECRTMCGTSACALGHAALIPELQRAGLRLHMVTSTEGEVLYRGFDGISAAQEFFGLLHSEAVELFGGDPCTPKRKAQQIRELLKSR